MPSAFLSHSNIDKPFVRGLKTDLEAAGISIWLDEDQIQPGQSFVDREDSQGTLMKIITLHPLVIVHVGVCGSAVVKVIQKRESGDRDS